MAAKLNTPILKAPFLVLVSLSRHANEGILFYFCLVKTFNTITISIITVALALLAADMIYMSRLYRSIKENVERDIRAALADTDIDEMWVRIMKNNPVSPHDDGSTPHSKRNLSGSMHNDEFITYETDSAGNTREIQRTNVTFSENYSNKFVAEMGQQLHLQIDDMLRPDIATLDSVFVSKLNKRGIYPDFAAVEQINTLGDVFLANPKLFKSKDGYYEAVHTYNPNGGLAYRAYVSPIARIVMQRMSGVVIFTLLLILTFAIAFIYMWRFIRRLKSLEEMKDGFVNSMTHELKTPVAVAFSAADSLQRYYDTSPPEHNKEYIGVIIRELSKHSAMVEHILSMSMERRKSMRLDREDVALLPLINEICSNQKLKADKQVNFRTSNIPSSLVIKTDPMHFANVITNLVENAIKYSGDSVVIEIEADNTSLKIRDNGNGIAAKYLPFIFDRFYRVPAGKDRYDAGGYGIGLYYVRNICGKLGWEITVASKAGHGTTFTIHFNGKARQDIVG